MKGKPLKTPPRRILALLSLAIAAMLPATAQAGMSFTVSGSGSSTTAFTEERASQGISVATAFDLLTFLKVSGSLRQEANTENGYKRVEGTGLYLYSKTATKVRSMSLDLQLILYPGELFVPYVFGGVGSKYFETSYTKESLDGSIQSGSNGGYICKFDIRCPNFGFGSGIAINRSFTITLTRTWTPGVRQDPYSGKPSELVFWDNYTSIGLTYRI